MGKVGMNFKWCQTCRYWGGMRDIDGFAKLVDSIDDHGKCNNLKGFYNQNMSKMASCPHHDPVL